MPRALVTICYLINITLGELEIYSLTDAETNLDRVRAWSWSQDPSRAKAPDSCSGAPVSRPWEADAGTDISATGGPADGKLKVAHGSWLHAERTGNRVV